MTLNDRVTRHLGASRRALFDAPDRSALKPLPAAPYIYAEWKECKAGLDYHVEVEKHYYSVPHALLRETLWADGWAKLCRSEWAATRLPIRARCRAKRQADCKAPRLT